MNKEVNVAVLGVGYWGRKVLGEYLNLQAIDPHFKVTQICDPKEENLSYCKDVFRLKSDLLNSDFEAVLKSPDVNAVHICTPNDTHYKIGLQALHNDKDVLLEKPLSLIPVDAWKLCSEAEHRHLCLQVGHIYRFSNAIRKAKELITNEFFGDLYYLKLQWTTWMPSPLGRDIVFDLGPHPIDILNFLLDKWPSKVSCIGKSYRRPSLEELAYFNLEFEKNLMAHVELSWLQPGKIRELNIIGSKNAATIDCLNQKIQIYEDNNGNNYNIKIEENNTIFDEVKHFVTSIRDENNHKNPGKVGAGNVAILESLKKSMETERSESVGF
jgi:UDP-N-acetylglucosamine 3-dehydrogenase